MSTIQVNDSIFVAEALEAFIADSPWVGVFAHDFNAESKQPGDRIFVPRVEALVATTFAGYSDSTFPYESSGGTINVITVTLDQQFIQTCDFTDVQRANSSAASFNNLARQQGKALAKQVWQRIATLFTTVNFGLAVQNISIANYGYTAGVSIMTTMVKRDVPQNNLSLIVNADVQNSFLNDPIVYADYSFGGDTARQGRVGRVAGMPVYPTNIMPTNGISLVGIACVPDAVAYACRYLEPQDTSVMSDARRVIDEPSGLVLGYRRHYNAGRGKMYATFECLFGFSVGLSLGIGILQRTN